MHHEAVVIDASDRTVRPLAVDRGACRNNDVIVDSDRFVVCRVRAGRITRRCPVPLLLFLFLAVTGLASYDERCKTVAGKRRSSASSIFGQKLIGPIWEQSRLGPS